MSSRSAQKNIRQERIVQILKQPYTIAEVAEILQVSYYTCRNDMNELVKQGVITPNGGMRNGSGLYIAGSKRPMPEFAASLSDHVRMDLLALTYLRSPEKSNSIEAISKLNRVMAELIYLACVARDNDTEVDQAELNNLRRVAQSANVRIQMLASVSEAFVANKTVWTSHTLPNVVDDPAFDATTYLLAYEEFLRREAEENESR